MLYDRKKAGRVLWHGGAAVQIYIIPRRRRGSAGTPVDRCPTLSETNDEEYDRKVEPQLPRRQTDGRTDGQTTVDRPTAAAQHRRRHLA